GPGEGGVRRCRALDWGRAASTCVARTGRARAASFRDMPKTFHHNFHRDFRHRACPPWVAGVIIVAIIAVRHERNATMKWSFASELPDKDFGAWTAGRSGVSGVSESLARSGDGDLSPLPLLSSAAGLSAALP